MASARIWNLPLSGYAPYPTGLYSIVADATPAIYYSRHTTDVVGALYTDLRAPSSARHNLLREWQVPAGLHFAQGGNGSLPSGAPEVICLDPQSNLWFAMRSGGSLVTLAANNVMTAYRNSQTFPWASGPTWYPFSSVTGLQYRDSEHLWFCGSGQVEPPKGWTSNLGPYIGRFIPSTGKATLWQIKSLRKHPWFGLAGPTSIWAEPGGEHVWCTLGHTQAHIFGALPHPFLWRLTPANGDSRIWHRVYPQQPLGAIGARSLVPDLSRRSTKLWMIRYDLSTQQLLSLDRSALSFEEIVPNPPAAMHNLTWLKDLFAGTASPRIMQRQVSPGCENGVTFETFDLTVTPDRYIADGQSVKVKPHEYGVPTAHVPVGPNRGACFIDFPTSAPGTGLVHPLGTSKPYTMAFGDFYGNTLGALEL